MSNEEQNDQEPVAEPAENTEATNEQTETPKQETVVPVREVQKERRERQKLEKEIEQLRQQQEEARQAELSEVEKLREALDQEKQRVAAAEQARTLSEQHSLIRTQASAAGFADTQDAITFVDFSALEGLEGAELKQAIGEELERVTEEKPYLLNKKEEGGTKRSVGRAADREGANNPPETGEDALGGFVHGLLFGKGQ